VPATPPPGFTLPAPPGLHDVAIPRLALEYTVVDGDLRTALRAGYFFQPSTAPDRPAQLQLDADRHVATCGIEILWRNRQAPLHASGFVQWHQLVGSGRAGGSLATAGLTLGVDL
jgi:hypothetical protein